MRNNKHKKWCVLFFCVCLILNTIPVSATTIDTDLQPVEETQEENEEEARELQPVEAAAAGEEEVSEPEAEEATEEVTEPEAEKSAEDVPEPKSEEETGEVTEPKAEEVPESQAEETTEEEPSTSLVEEAIEDELQMPQVEETEEVILEPQMMEAEDGIALLAADETAAEVLAVQLTEKENGSVWGSGILTGSGELDKEKSWNKDTGENKGYDNSYDNDIIRSFDSITYNVSASVQANKTEHTLIYEITLPDDEELTLDETKMNAQKITCRKNEDGTKTYRCEYPLQSDYAGGEKEEKIIVKVGNKHQDYKIEPVIKAYLDNDADKSKTAKNVKPVTVTSAPMYNIVLKQTNDTNPARGIYDFSKVNNYGAKTLYPGEKVNGYERNYGFALELYKPGGYVKGVELPDPETGISFDIDLSAMIGGDSLAEKGFYPLLYSMGLNENGSQAIFEIPVGHPFMGAEGKQIGCKKSGSVSVTQEDTVLHVKVTGFEVDGTAFPQTNYAKVSYWEDQNAIREGVFAAFQFKIIYPYINKDGKTLTDKFLAGGTINVGAEVKNIKAISETKTPVITETKTDDNSQQGNWALTAGGKREHQICYTNRSEWTKEYTPGKKWSDGDIAPAGADDLAFTAVYEEGGVGEAYAASENPVAIDQLVLFDRAAIAHVRLKMYSNDTGYRCTMRYAVHQSGRLDNNAMKSAELSDFTFFDTEPEGGYDGILLEYRGLPNSKVVKSLNLMAQCEADLQEGVKADQVYMITVVTNSWTAGDLETKIRSAGETNIDNVDRNTIRNRVQAANPAELVKDMPHTPETIDHRSEYDIPSYVEGVYTVGSTHRTKINYADGLYIVPYTTTVAKTVAQLNTDGSPVSIYQASWGQRYADYKISSSIKYWGNVTPPENAVTTVYLEDTLPKGLTYLPGSAHWGGTYTQRFPQAGLIEGGLAIEPAITAAADGSTVLKWTIPDVALKNGELPTLYYSCTIGDELNPANDVEDNQYLENTVKIQTDEDKRPYQSELYNLAKTGITVKRGKEFYIVKRGGDDLELEDTSSYELIAANTSSADQKNLCLFDTMPYKGDQKSRQIEGAYTISAVTMDAGAVHHARDIELWYTKEASYIGKTADDIDVSEVTEASGWKKAEASGYDSERISFTGEGLIGSWPTAIAYKDAALEQNTVAAIRIDYDVIGSEKDDFKNAWSVRSNGAELSSSVNTKIYSRSLDGIVWLDDNKDGKIGDTEKRLQGVKVTLLRKNGSGDYVPYTAYEEMVNGERKQCAAELLTDADGHYKFTGLPSGDYRVEFSSSDNVSLSAYEVTAANVDTDITKTSKVEQENTVKENKKLVSGTIMEIVMPTLSEMASNGQQTYHLPDQNLGLTEVPEDPIPDTPKPENPTPNPIPEEPKPETPGQVTPSTPDAPQTPDTPSPKPSRKSSKKSKSGQTEMTVQQNVSQQSTVQQTTQVSTGDTTGTAVWVMLAIVALCGIGWTVIRRKLCKKTIAKQKNLL